MPEHYDEEAIKTHFTELNIKEYLDSGGFKDVFLAEENGEQFVLKLLPVNRRHQLRRARREADAMQKIESDVFVDLLDYYEDEIGIKRSFVIYEEYIPGKTLKQVIEDGDHSLELALETTWDILNVLDEIQEIPLIHRDIKPSNIMVQPDGQIRLLDVGIARHEEKDSLTPDHADRGPATRQYAAPEQLENRKEEQSIRTDIFSLGIVFFETITGEHPFLDRGKSVSDAICEGDKDTLESHIGGHEQIDDLQLFFDICTEVEPHDRFRKPGHAKELLNDIMEGNNV